MYILDLHTLNQLKILISQNNLKLNDVILIETDKNILVWALGKVIEIFPGRDGKVHSCLVKIENRIFKRHVQLLYSLNINYN